MAGRSGRVNAPLMFSFRLRREEKIDRTGPKRERDAGSKRYRTLRTNAEGGLCLEKAKKIL